MYPQHLSDGELRAFVDARCTLFAKYLSPAQTEEVRRRQLATMAHLGTWPALVAELRAQMDAGTDVRDAPVQAIVQRWQQLLRDSYCGDDAALEALVREAIICEPDLRVDGIDDALLAYLQKAHVAAHHVPQENAGPKPSAMMVAMQRAAHQLLEQPRVLDDPLALTILGATEEQALRADLDNTALRWRWACAARSWFAAGWPKTNGPAPSSAACANT
jgi:hypothetical protein